MKLVSVVCRVIEDGGIEHLHNVEPAVFMDLLSNAVEGDADDLAALEAELSAAKPSPPVPNVVPNATTLAAVAEVEARRTGGEIVLPRAVIDPLVAAKTRGELIEKVNELLSQFGARVAKEGEL